MEKIISNEFHKLEKSSYANASDKEKQQIKQAHIALIKKGATVWNKWAAELKNHILKNKEGEYFIDLSGTEFHDLSFSGFVFPCHVSFRETTFRSDANFRKAQFADGANFSKAHFAGYAFFWEALFSGKAEFCSTQFMGDSIFAEAHFNNSAEFRKAHFNGSAEFKKAQFNGGAEFRKVKFAGKADFMSARLTGSNVFSDSRFKDDTYFFDAVFEDRTYINRVKFNGRAYFNDAQFKGSTYFNHSKWMLEVSFDATQFDSLCDFDSSLFKTVPNFNFASFKQPPHIEGLAIETTEVKAEKGLVERYRKLKDMAIQSKDFENELKYFGLETLSKAYLPTTSKSKKQFILAYKVFSDFGASLTRPIIALLIFLFSMSAVNGSYMLLVNDVSKECREDRLKYSSAVVQYTFSESSPLFKLEPERATEIEVCLFRKKAQDIRNSLWRLVHLLPTTLFLFLFGLAIRNKFKIR